VVGGDAGCCLGPEVDVDPEAGQVLVAALGLQFGRAAAGRGQVLQAGVPQLVQGPALTVGIMGGGGLFEQVFRAGVGQSAATGGRVDV
jgi:hypothetical protein